MVATNSDNLPEFSSATVALNSEANFSKTDTTTVHTTKIKETTFALERQVPVGIIILATTALMTLAFAGLSYVQAVFAPFFLALTLVLAFRPIGRKLVKHGAPVWLAIITTMIVLVVTFVGTVSLLVWSFTPVPVTLMRYSGRFEQTLNSLGQFLESYDIQTFDFQKLLSEIDYNTVIRLAWNVADSLSSMGGLIAIVVVALFFITIDTATLDARSKVSRTWHSDLTAALAGFEKRVRSYWIISTFFGLIVAVVDVVALQMLAIPLAWTWGVWAFVTNYIPNIGFVIGVLPPMLMALLDQGWQAMLWVALIYSLINVLIQTFLQPKLTGDVVGLSATVTFISLVLWTLVIGILGSILAVPLTLFFKALLIDADPRTRWLDVFLVSEKEVKKREAQKQYDLQRANPKAPAEVSTTLETFNQHLPHISQGNQKIKSLLRTVSKSVRGYRQAKNSNMTRSIYRRSKKK